MYTSFIVTSQQVSQALCFMRCYRVRGKEFRGLYQKVTVQGSGENPHHLSLLEANSLCWLQLWYILYKHAQPMLLSPEKFTWKTPCFPSLASQVSPPYLYGPVIFACGHSQWAVVRQKQFAGMFIPSLFFDGKSYFSFAGLQNWFGHPDSRKAPVWDKGIEYTAASRYDGMS